MAESAHPVGYAPRTSHAPDRYAKRTLRFCSLSPWERARVRVIQTGPWPRRRDWNVSEAKGPLPVGYAPRTSQAHDRYAKRTLRCRFHGGEIGAGEFLDRLNIARPIRRIYPLPDPPVKTRIGPIAHPVNMAMFHRVMVDVIEMPGIVGLVAQGMFPKSALPYPPPPLSQTRTAPALFATARSQISRGEFLLDPAPPRRIPAIALRQRPNGVQMVGEQHQGIDAKRPASAAFAHRRPQAGACGIRTENRHAPFRHHREEIGTARYPHAPIVRHKPNSLGWVRSAYRITELKDSNRRLVRSAYQSRDRIIRYAQRTLPDSAYPITESKHPTPTAFPTRFDAGIVRTQNRHPPFHHHVEINPAGYPHAAIAGHNPNSLGTARSAYGIAELKDPKRRVRSAYQIIGSNHPNRSVPIPRSKHQVRRAYPTCPQGTQSVPDANGEPP